MPPPSQAHNDMIHNSTYLNLLRRGGGGEEEQRYDGSKLSRFVEAKSVVGGVSGLQGVFCFVLAAVYWTLCRVFRSQSPSPPHLSYLNCGWTILSLLLRFKSCSSGCLSLSEGSSYRSVLVEGEQNCSWNIEGYEGFCYGFKEKLKLLKKECG